MCLCLRNTTGARASALLSLSASARFFPTLSLSFSSFLRFFPLFPGFFPLFLLLLPCSYVHARRSTGESFLSAVTAASAFVTLANIARRGGPRRTGHHHRASVWSCLPSLGPPPLLRRFFAYFFRALFDEKPRRVKLLMVSRRGGRKREISRVSCILFDSPHGGLRRRIILADVLREENSQCYCKYNYFQYLDYIFFVFVVVLTKNQRQQCAYMVIVINIVWLKL